MYYEIYYSHYLLLLFFYMLMCSPRNGDYIINYIYNHSEIKRITTPAGQGNRRHSGALSINYYLLLMYFRDKRQGSGSGKPPRPALFIYFINVIKSFIYRYFHNITKNILFFLKICIDNHYNIV